MLGTGPRGGGADGGGGGGYAPRGRPSRTCPPAPLSLEGLIASLFFFFPLSVHFACSQFSPPDRPPGLPLRRVGLCTCARVRGARLVATHPPRRRAAPGGMAAVGAGGGHGGRWVGVPTARGPRTPTPAACGPAPRPSPPPATPPPPLRQRPAAGMRAGDRGRTATAGTSSTVRWWHRVHWDRPPHAVPLGTRRARQATGALAVGSCTQCGHRTARQPVRCRPLSQGETALLCCGRRQSSRQRAPRTCRNTRPYAAAPLLARAGAYPHAARGSGPRFGRRTARRVGKRNRAAPADAVAHAPTR